MQATMQKTALVTGGFGFLGRAVALKLKRLGYRVIGIGHGRWGEQEALVQGFDVWLDADVSLSALMTLDERFALVVHCAGSGSVGYSQANPLQDFYKTVYSTADLLEYLRLNESQALLVYPSSAGVYGAKDDRPIPESDTPNPVSPYGYHKKIAEDLLTSYSRNYGTRVTIIRFFSIYGPGLTKQLLWDASIKLSTAQGEASFWGTGEETRDWIHLDDATELIITLAESASPCSIVNGATGTRVTVKEVLEMLKRALGVDVRITFNGAQKAGDPRFYHADVSMLRQLGVPPNVLLADGLKAYADWFKRSWSPT
jgi:UDP-glucose 4-epimerase